MTGSKNRWPKPRRVGGYAPGRRKIGGIWVPDDAEDQLQALVKVNFAVMKVSFKDEGFDFSKDKLITGEIDAVEEDIKARLVELIEEIREKQRHIFMVRDAISKLEGVVLECIDFMHTQFRLYGVSDESRARGIISRVERNLLDASKTQLKKWK